MYAFSKKMVMLSFSYAFTSPSFFRMDAIWIVQELQDSARVLLLHQVLELEVVLPEMDLEY